MTQVFVKTEEKCISVSVKGHSGYADSGEDIICAALSSNIELVADIFDVFGVKYAFDADGSIPLVRIEVCFDGKNAAKKKEILSIVRGFTKFVTDLSESYPDNAQIITEV